MIAATAQPSLKMLNGFISKIRSFPISAGQLQAYATKVKAPREIIEFYKTFAADRVFDDKEELAGSSEQVEVMRQEGKTMPEELERSPEEF